MLDILISTSASDQHPEQTAFYSSYIAMWNSIISQISSYLCLWKVVTEHVLAIDLAVLIPHCNT